MVLKVLSLLEILFSSFLVLLTMKKYHTIVIYICALVRPFMLSTCVGACLQMYSTVMNGSC